MSSHSRKLAETIRAIDNLKNALQATAYESEYNRGLYNGIELMRSMLNGMEAKIINNKIHVPVVNTFLAREKLDES